MIIDEFETVVLSLPYTPAGGEDGFGGKPWRSLDYLLLRLVSRDGLTGWGEGFGYDAIPATKAVLDNMVRPLLVGREFETQEGLLDFLERTLHLFGRGGPVRFAISAVDIALWDIKGKVAGLSISQLLSPSPAKTVPCYASMLKLGAAELVASETQAALSSGYRAVKLHETSLECVSAARTAGGGSTRITLDVNCAWDQRGAIAMAHELEPFGLDWLEEPVWPPEDEVALRAVSSASSIPIAAGENASTIGDLHRLVRSGGCRVIQPSVTKLGGVSALVRLAGMADDPSVSLAPHSPYLGPGLLATIQASSALGFGPVESLYVDCPDRIYDGLAPDRNGELHVPDGPGLGIDVDIDRLLRFRAA